MVYIRKIEELRWRNPHFYDSDIISDLLTSEHDLSVWCYEDGNEDAKNKALLAMIMSRNEFKDFFYVELTDREIKRCNFSLNFKEGSTQFSKYKNLHRNIEVKTVLGLTTLAWVLKRKISRGEFQHMEPDEERNLFMNYADPSEMSFDELIWKGYKKLYKEKNNIK